MYQYSAKKIVYPKPRRAPKFLLYFLIMAILAGGGAYGLYASKILEVQDIVVKGDDPQLDAELATQARAELPYLFSSTATAARALQKTHPTIHQVTVNMDLFARNAHVSYQARKPRFLWCNGPQGSSQCYFVDAQGIIFDQADVVQSTFFLNVKDFYLTDFAVGKRIPSHYVELMTALEKALKGKDLAISYLRIDAPFSIKVIPVAGPELRFSAQKPPSEQAESLLLFLDSLPKEEVMKLAYVDLRIKNRVYYK